MTRYCVLDENNKMQFLNDDFLKEFSNISDGIIQYKNKKYECIELDFKDETIKIFKDITKYTKLQEKNSELKNLVSELRKENKGLKRDSLMGLYRADCAMKVVREYISHAYENNIPFSLVMADVDKFKNVNDTYGHEFGNQVLAIVGRTLLENVRTNLKPVDKESRRMASNKLPSLERDDIVIRYGGEEVLLLIKNISLKDTINRVEQIRKKIENIKINEINVTVSFGIFNFDDKNKYPHISDDNIYKAVSRIVQNADKAMYNSKKNGRNLTSVYDNETGNIYVVK